MQELAETGMAAWEWVLYGGIGVFFTAGMVRFVLATRKAEKNIIQKLDDVKASYSDDLGRDELVDMYNRARAINYPNVLKERHGELKDLIGKVEAQLQPIIKDEVRASLPQANITPKTSLEELSETYRETYGRYQTS